MNRFNKNIFHRTICICLLLTFCMGLCFEATALPVIMEVEKSYDLGGGYSIHVIEINLEKAEALFILNKEGREVDSAIGREGDSFDLDDEDVFYFAASVCVIADNEVGMSSYDCRVYDKKTLVIGYNWELVGGYSIEAIQIDPEEGEANFVLLKEGIVVDEEDASTWEEEWEWFSLDDGDNFYFEADLDAIFRDVDTNIVQLDYYTWNWIGEPPDPLIDTDNDVTVEVIPTPVEAEVIPTPVPTRTDGDGVNIPIIAAIITALAVIAAAIINYHTSRRQPHGSISATPSPDGARVFLDGVDKGESPVTLDKVQKGTHIVLFSKSGYSDCEKRVVVNADQITPVHCDLKKLEMKLRLSAEPVEIPADGKSKSVITISVEDEDGTPAPVPEDVTIVLETNIGLIDTPVGIPARDTQATSILTSSTAGGTATVRAESEIGLKGSVEVRFAWPKKLSKDPREFG